MQLRQTPSEALGRACAWGLCLCPPCQRHGTAPGWQHPLSGGGFFVTSTFKAKNRAIIFTAAKSKLRSVSRVSYLICSGVRLGHGWGGPGLPQVLVPGQGCAVGTTGCPLSSETPPAPLWMGNPAASQCKQIHTWVRAN